MSKNLSTQLYSRIIQPDTMRALLAGYFRDDKGEAVGLLQNNGVQIASDASAKDVQIAWLKAIKDSDSFRDQAASLLTNYIYRVTGKGTSTNNFVGSNAEQVAYYNDVTDISSIDPNSFSTAALASTDSSSTDTSWMNSGIFSESPSPAATTPAAAAPAAPASTPASNSGGFWSSLGSIFTPAVLQTGVKTGLQAVSTNLTASANQTTEKTALQIEQTKLAAAQAQTQANQAAQGMSTGTIVALVAGSLLVVTVIIVLVTRKK